jgi:hypothetical protein
MVVFESLKDVDGAANVGIPHNMESISYSLWSKSITYVTIQLFNGEHSQVVFVLAVL